MEKVKTIGSARLARDKGFYFELVPPTPEEIIADNVPGTRWDLPLAHRDEAQKASCSADGLNSNLILDLQAKFPSLHVVAHWRKTVQFCANDVHQQHEHYNKSGLSCPFSKRISLLSIAQGILRDFVRRSAAQNVLRSSRYSLMAVQVFALGLRGIVADCMGQSLTHHERVAMGTVRALPRIKNQDFVSLFVSGTTIPPATTARSADNSGQSSSQRTAPDASSSTASPFMTQIPPRAALSGDKDSEELNMERNRLFSMSWSEYVQFLDSSAGSRCDPPPAPSSSIPGTNVRESSDTATLPNVNIDSADIDDMLDDVS